MPLLYLMGCASQPTLSTLNDKNCADVHNLSTYTLEQIEKSYVCSKYEEVKQ